MVRNDINLPTLNAVLHDVINDRTRGIGIGSKKIHSADLRESFDHYCNDVLFRFTSDVGEFRCRRLAPLAPSLKSRIETRDTPITSAQVSLQDSRAPQTISAVPGNSTHHGSYRAEERNARDR
jgi:hypothetical protein